MERIDVTPRRGLESNMKRIRFAIAAGLAALFTVVLLPAPPASATIHEIVAAWRSGHGELQPPGIQGGKNFASRSSRMASWARSAVLWLGGPGAADHVQLRRTRGQGGRHWGLRRHRADPVRSALRRTYYAGFVVPGLQELPEFHHGIELRLEPLCSGTGPRTGDAVAGSVWVQFVWRSKRGGVGGCSVQGRDAERHDDVCDEGPGAHFRHGVVTLYGLTPSRYAFDTNPPCFVRLHTFVASVSSDALTLAPST